MPVNDASKKNDEVTLARVPCIYYLLCFWKDRNKVQALLDLGNKLNAMKLAYALKLGLKVCHTNIEAQRIDDSIFEILQIALASFQVEYKLRKVRFFHKSFLLADTSIKMMLEMLFLTFSNADKVFLEQELA